MSFPSLNRKIARESEAKGGVFNWLLIAVIVVLVVGAIAVGWRQILLGLAILLAITISFLLSHARIRRWTSKPDSG
jgi:hypothetical protein